MNLVAFNLKGPLPHRTQPGSRVRGEIFIAPKHILETRQKNAAGHICKYFAPTALAILIATVAILPSAGHAQRLDAQASASSIPSPRSVFGFDPGDDRKIM